MQARAAFVSISIIVSGSILFLGTLNVNFLWWFLLVAPLVILGIVDMVQTKRSLRRNFPLIARMRYLLEKIRPEIMQYFVETDIEGRPINRMMRSLIYQRAKKVNDTAPFGTQIDVYNPGYEWMDHSIYAEKSENLDKHPRIKIGGSDCNQPYAASILNVSAMSYGSLSKNAVMAMNWGAKMDDFAQNTGEGGLSEFHLKYGGDLIWQIGTGYFGCRTHDGHFNEEMYKERAGLENVKMIELKLSQGAKPGHGGILPASKNTEEIAKIRGVKPHTDVISPPTHNAFEGAVGLMEFIKKLRDLSGGKPTGFKLCIGKKAEFVELCQAMISTGIKPDFITIDGGEGGTGAAPVEFTNSLGMPLREGLAYAVDTLRAYDLKKEVKIIAAGKIITGFHMARVLALGADLCYSARAMMISVGCIQALQCNSNTCPTGVATQDKNLMKGLDVENKAHRIKNYHHETVHSFVELIAAAGCKSPQDLKRIHINRRVSATQVLRYDEIFPDVVEGSLVPVNK